MTCERDLEDVIWGRKDWNRYVAELAECDSVDEHVLLQRIELVKDSIGRQLRRAVGFVSFHNGLLIKASTTAPYAAVH